MNIRTRKLVENDIQYLKPVLKQHIRDRDTGEVVENEVEDVISYMKGAQDAESRVRTYYVAEINDKVIGCMAYAEPDKDMRKHFGENSSKSVELLNAFVSVDHYRGKGVGKMLLKAVLHDTKSKGYEYLLVCSGPRYKQSWGFYDRFFDENTGFIKEKYGRDGDAKTWIKKL
ncbi:GNAT family N-acetyltransferase [Patescibacteria group bacterium]|nr:GNAT family N-acetyltransferase [Patescibacteria group bacterium]